MAHYIADLINSAERATGPDRDSIRLECAAEILRLWSHRLSFPSTRPPTASFEPIYRALTRLDPDQPRWSFFGLFNSDSAPTDEQLEINTLLRLALNVEEAARDAVRELITSAAQRAAQHEAKWLELAANLIDEKSQPLGALRRLRLADTTMRESERVSAGRDITAIERLSTACLAALKEHRRTPETTD
ncbi:hypothetical protein R8Z50_21935 [Longispora sp. K20-0274]|uniref:hypothetical protein n=1 Tax=Longispora sp. K20-0274 TaxID=3088255 RepID=UPI00399A4336